MDVVADQSQESRERDSSVLWRCSVSAPAARCSWRCSVSAPGSRVTPMWRTRLGEQFLDIDAPATLARQEMRGTLDYNVSWERRSGRFGLDAKLNKPPPRTAPRPSGTTWSSVQSARAAPEHVNSLSQDHPRFPYHQRTGRFTDAGSSRDTVMSPPRNFVQDATSPDRRTAELSQTLTFPRSFNRGSETGLKEMPRFLPPPRKPYRGRRHGESRRLPPSPPSAPLTAPASGPQTWTPTTCGHGTRRTRGAGGATTGRRARRATRPPVAATNRSHLGQRDCRRATARPGRAARATSPATSRPGRRSTRCFCTSIALRLAHEIACTTRVAGGTLPAAWAMQAKAYPAPARQAEPARLSLLPCPASTPASPLPSTSAAHHLFLPPSFRAAKQSMAGWCRFDQSSARARASDSGLNGLVLGPARFGCTALP